MSNGGRLRMGRGRLAAGVLVAAVLAGCGPAAPAGGSVPRPDGPAEVRAPAVLPEPAAARAAAAPDPAVATGRPMAATLALPGGRVLAVGQPDGQGTRTVALLAGGAVAGTATVRLPGEGVTVSARDLPGHPGALVLAARRERGEPQYAAVAVAGEQLQVLDYYALTAPAPEVTAGAYIYVDKYLNHLWLFRDGRLVRHYPVATGRQTAGPPPTPADYQTNYFTPEGRFTIAQKVVNPRYYGSASHPPAAGGAPDNPLGTRWMGFVAVKGLGPEVWGIHGTNEPERIGTWASDGCVRMETRQAEELFDLVPAGTVLRIASGRAG